MFDKLDDLLMRFEEILNTLNDPAVIADQARFQKLMKEQGIPAGNVLRHFDIVNKTCPAPYVHNNKYKTSWTWDEFKAKIGGGQDIGDARDAQG